MSFVLLDKLEYIFLHAQSMIIFIAFFHFNNYHFYQNEAKFFIVIFRWLTIDVKLSCKFFHNEILVAKDKYIF